MSINEEKVKEALSSVIYPGFTKDIVSFGFVKDISVDGDKVRLHVDITSSAEEVQNELREEIRKALHGIGVKEIELDLTAPKPPRMQSNTMSGKNMAPQIENFVMISSGKGGVGKSTTSVNLAIALAMQGKKVGLLDADMYGPNIPRMMGIEDQKPQIEGNKVIPLKAYGVEVMSMGLLLEPGQSLIWRGSMIMKAIEQFLRDILWSDLDVLVIDMPPGTGDAQLSLAQLVPVTAGLTVTTPQEVSLDDSRRSLDMFKKLHIPIAGIVENMSGFICPKCGEESDIFGMGTTEPVAKEYDTQVLARIPIEPAVRVGGDTGQPVVYHKPDSETAKRFQEAATKLSDFLKKVEEEGGVDNAAIQPTTPPGVSACSTGAGASTAGANNAPQGGSCGTGCGCH